MLRGMLFGMLIFALAGCNSMDLSPSRDVFPASSATSSVTPSSTATPRAKNSATPFVATVTLAPARTLELTFKRDNINVVPPEDVIKELSYFGGFGGGGDVCALETYQSPSFWDDDLYSSPGKRSEKYSAVYIDVCGLSIGEVVQVVVNAPNGSSQTYRMVSEQVEEQDQGEIRYTFIAQVNDPAGLYRIRFQGNNWSLETSVEVVEPTSARLYLVDQNKLVFYRFQPHEHVRLLAYEAEHYEGLPYEMYGGISLVGWKDYYVDANGYLIVPVEIGDGFVAIGDVSGVVHHSAPETYFWAGYVSDIYCPGVPSRDLVPGSYAFAVADSLPVLDGNTIRYLKKGETVRLISNPTCEDDGWWWNVRCIGSSCDFDNGTVQEGDRNTAFLHPLDVYSKESDGVIPVCVDPLPTRLHVGMKAQVTTSGMAPQLSLRYEPSMNSSKAHVIAAGRKMDILAGPLCVDGSYWWYVRSEQGFEGWAREGDYEDYWIDPLE